MFKAVTFTLTYSGGTPIYLTLQFVLWTPDL